VRVTLLPSSLGTGPDAPLAFLTTILINDAVAIDAGSLGFHGSPCEQARIKHVLLSHTHMDHVASLPIFVENLYTGGNDPVTVYGSEEVLHSVQSDLFNGRVWPDFIGLSRPEAPFLKLSTLTPGRPVEVAGLRITPVSVHHAVPTLGFLIEDESAALVISSDTGPTEELWARANALPHLKGVILEASFPNSMADLAERAGHLTPATFARELSKLHRTVPVFATHLKARYRAEIVRELEALGLPQVHIALSGVPYQF
jgi:ribonuclease BN (tRNA processing enzyme)